MPCETQNKAKFQSNRFTQPHTYSLPFTVSNPYENNVWFIPATEVSINKGESLGRGGFGDVYTGFYGTNAVAIKTITGLIDPKAIKMAKDEAALWYTLKHPNITILFGVSVDEGSNPVLIIERAQRSLYSRLYRGNGEKPATKEEKLRWIMEIAQAFKYLHAQKNPVIHADLNPRNVLLAFGTMRYSPPESFSRRYHATTAHDVYCFAMTIYEILSEIQPFNDALHVDMIPTWVSNGERPESMPDKIPEDSWEWSLIQSCWHQDPSKRPSFNEIVKVIQDHSALQNLEPQSFVRSASITLSSESSKTFVNHPSTDLTQVQTDPQSGREADPSAQTKVGLMYKNGAGVPQDYSKAFEILSRAAARGNVVAQLNLGEMYQHGQGVAQDYLKAMECLGYMYHMGLGVAQDNSKAVEWYTCAAHQGNPAGQNSLGWMYRNGLGVAQDYSKAVEWYTRAANQGNIAGQNSLGYMFHYGQGVDQDYSKAAEWYTQAAKQGDPSAQYYLGCKYLYGQGVAKDYSKAIEWLTLAANQGVALAQKTLGDIYDNDVGVPRNQAAAKYWKDKAEKAGCFRPKLD
ncbi:kinase-like domain-containing protein [Obelidium mucronatum]|nr:kinase-like domain-containing protein [Obelidium mucronatum]